MKWIFLALISLGHPAYGLEGEFSAGIAPLNFTSGGSGSQFLLGFQIKFEEWMTAGAELDYRDMTYQENSMSLTTIRFGATALIGPKPDHWVLFVGPVIRMGSAANAGTSTVSTTSSVSEPTGFGYFISMGKLFELGGGFFYRPDLAIVSAGGFGLIINPIRLAYVF